MRTYPKGKPYGKTSLRVFINQDEYRVVFYPDAVGLENQNRSRPWLPHKNKYRVSKNSCDCPAAQQIYGPCKHILALRKLKQGLDLALQSEIIPKK